MGDVGDFWRDQKEDYHEHVRSETERRMEYALTEIRKRNYAVAAGPDSLTFTHKGHVVRLYPYKGWFTGKTVKDGRGIKNLLKQLDGE